MIPVTPVSLMHVTHQIIVINFLIGQLLSLVGPLATVILAKINYLNHRKLTSKSKNVGCQYTIDQNLPIITCQTSPFEPAEQNLCFLRGPIGSIFDLRFHVLLSEKLV